MKFKLINENDPSQNFSIDAETYEEACEKALTELGFMTFRDWDDDNVLDENPLKQ